MFITYLSIFVLLVTGAVNPWQMSLHKPAYEKVDAGNLLEIVSIEEPDDELKTGFDGLKQCTASTTTGTVVYVHADCNVLSRGMKLEIRQLRNGRNHLYDINGDIVSWTTKFSPAE